ncbi:carbohydrate ABC transporter permease [Streptomyces diastatochromogenes]|uniref:Transporter n=1 Tax=Streptomyces diastatochromogenes TaxID=42236 RepID=A0A233SB17_STRDA|nr:sugar ABC transporter permease [Streptomyces diastatochromogenes]MCZ0985379.1 sugar ABC transporter permease [Streptomyces diastatochromogenes]OXY92858.1 transporter [Streptomyces diastatochromogenes]
MSTLTRPPRVATDSPVRRTSARRTGKRGAYKGVLFTLPFLIGFLATYVAPIAYAFSESLHEKKSSGIGFGPTKVVYTGFSNFAAIFADGTFWTGMLRTLLFGAAQIVVMLGISLLLALLLDGVAARAVRFFRAALLVPYVIPAVVSTLMWLFLYSPTASPILDVADRAGAHFDFFGGLNTYLSLGNVLTWQGIGFNMILISASLQALPRELYEAARLDGAREWRIAWSVKVPNITGILVLTGMFSLIGRLQLFAEPLFLRYVAPESINTDFTPMMEIFDRAFKAGDYQYAAAESLVLAVVTGLLAFVFYRVTNRKMS